jgi:hypothetical protein
MVCDGGDDRAQLRLASIALGAVRPVQFALVCQFPDAFTFHAGGGAAPMRAMKTSRRVKSPQLLVNATHRPSKLMSARGVFQ